VTCRCATRTSAAGGPDHDVFRREHGTKRYHHPVVGELTLAYEALTPTDDPDQTLGLHTAEPGSPSEQALRLLASWTSEPARSTLDG